MKLNKHTPQNILTILGISLILGLAIYGMISPWLPKTISEINNEYGRRGGRGSDSVNGTAVFADMFRQQGIEVRSWTQLSPRLQRSDVVVWTPNSFELPSAKEIEYFENEWLGREDDRYRTLIYVARDYEAAVDYWQTQKANTQGNQWIRTRRSLARAQSDHAYARSLTAKEMTCEWFSIDSSQYFFDVTPSDGAWSSDLDSEATEIAAAGKLKLPEAENLDCEILLASEETPLIVRITDEYNWPTGQIIVLLNGSSVLNLPLVNHENRKIAANLIEMCEDATRVTFLESGAAGLRISTDDAKAYSGFEALTVWPINSILLHLIVAGILFCAMVFPIFGRPRNITDDRLSDFGKHIRAMGELLSISGDRQAAMAKVQQYRNLKIEPVAPDRQPKTQETGNPFKVSQA